MDLTLRKTHCVHCRSENLTASEWPHWLDRDQIKDKEEWFFADELDSYIKESFEASHEIKILFHCDDCSRWFTVNVEAIEVDEYDIPFLDIEEPYLSVIALFDHTSQLPYKILIGEHHFDLQVLSWKKKNILFPRKAIGPFYPYPAGTYKVICQPSHLPEDYSRKKPFNCILASTYLSIASDAEDLDSQFYNFRLSKVSMEIYEMLLDLENKRIDRSTLVAVGDEDPYTDMLPSIHLAASYARNEAAYRFYLLLENELRAFVWELYSEKNQPADSPGDWWVKAFNATIAHRITRAMSKSRTIHGASKSTFPMDYCDFDGLMSLIEDEVDFLVSVRPLDVRILRGHFQYLKHFRNAIAHSRLLSHDDLMTIQQHGLGLCQQLGIERIFNMRVLFYEPPLTI